MVKGRAQSGDIENAEAPLDTHFLYTTLAKRPN